MLSNPFLDDTLFLDLFSEFQALLETKTFRVLEKGTNPSALVTELDVALQELVLRKLSPWLEQHNISFLSEELPKRELAFPTVILDPLDGTRSFVQGSSEYSLALSWHTGPKLTSDSHVGAILAPSQKFMITSWDLCHHRKPIPPAKPLRGLVSSSEWSEGVFARWDQCEHELIPMGSIALKLAKLAAEQAHFVVSMRPKSIWDVAAGTVLLTGQGVAFYEQGKRVSELNRLQFLPPLIWAAPEHISAVLELCEQL